MTLPTLAPRNRLYFLPFFLIFFALALHTAVAMSPTNDEPVHILRGYALVSRGDLRFQGGHPPFAHRLIGLLLPTETSLPPLDSLPSWEVTADRPTISRELFSHDTTNVRRVLFLSRVPIILAGLLFGAVMIRWAGGSLVMAALWAFAPNWLAHTTLATTDGLVTMAFGLAGFTIWRYRNAPTWRNGLLAGLAIGCTLATKTTGILMLPISGLLLLTTWKPAWSWWESIKQWLFLLPIIGLTVWLIHGFELRPVPYAPFPLPAATYWDSIFDVSGHVAGGHVAFLQGEITSAGWWHYFVIAFFAKTPLPVLLLLGAAVVTLLRQREGWASRDAWFPALLLFAIASYTRLNIGYRHILPMLPFVWLLIAYASPHWRAPFLRVALFVLLIWYAASSLLQAPDYISYFNLVSRKSAETLLGDSNIDWGQDFWSLVDYAKGNEVIVSYSGFLDPHAYGLTTLAIDPETGFIPNFANANPAPGRYAISLNHLQGTLIREPDAFAWFRDKTPVAKLGGSIYVYEVASALTGDWIAHCAAPLSPLQPEQAEQLVGQSGLRQLFFDCTQSWVFPNRGSGWYVLPSAEMAAWLPNELTTEWSFIYTHRPTADSADYTLLYLPAPPALTDSWAGAVSLENGDSVTLPLALGQSAQLHGYQHNETDWLTYWQVLDEPSPFLSILAHLYDATPTPLAVADGLGFASAQWESADFVLQRHSFPQSVSCENGRLATGLYDFTTGERIPIGQTGSQLFLAACVE